MRISVVIPAYNAATTIRAAIESCLNQTMPAHEIIVVDDCSTDTTSDIILEYKPVTLLRQKQNAGPSAARNRGWNEATGDIIAFLDADDTWQADKLQTVVDVFAARNNLQLLGHNYSVKYKKTPVDSERIFNQGYLATLLSNPFQPSCMTVRRSLPTRFDDTYRYCEDHEFALKVAHKYECAYLDVALTQLGRPQLSAGGASGNMWKMRRGELRLYSSIYRHNPLFIFLIPFLWIFSIAKMLYRIVQK